MDNPLRDDTSAFEEALTRVNRGKYLLKLYVAGNSERSKRAIEQIHDICETHLKGRYQLEVIDIYQLPQLARGEQIIAAPTLIKQLPPPLRRMVGDLSKVDRVLVGLDIHQIDPEIEPDGLESGNGD
jgi:circadian clock protein KaiB